MQRQTLICFFLPENAGMSSFDEYDYIVDAVDTVTAKISLVMSPGEKCKIISSMGAEIKLDASAFKVAYNDKGMSFSQGNEKRVKETWCKKLKVVYSEEPAMTPAEDMAISCRQTAFVHWEQNTNALKDEQFQAVWHLYHQ